MVLTATPDKDWVFVEWKGGLTGEENPATISIDEAKEVTAVFEKKDYPLNVTTVGGGAVSETLIESEVGSDYLSGSEVELTAEAAYGWAFVEWQGDLSGTENPSTITVDESKEVIAVFEREEFSLSTSFEGEGSVGTTLTSGSQTVNGYLYESEVELTAEADNEWIFVEWKGDHTGTENPSTIDIDESKEVTAVFEKSFHLHENGITVLCPRAQVGDSGSVNGKTYTKRTADQIKEENAEETCTTGITDMSELFYDPTGAMPGTDFNGDLRSWDVSSVTDMSRMFFYAYNFNQDISNWDVSSVTDMSRMFFYAYNFNQDISNWDVSSVTRMDGMFDGSQSFDQDIGNWDVSSVTSMARMFQESDNFNQDLTGWCVSSIDTEPTDFATNSSLTESNKPVWGTCPTP